MTAIPFDTLKFVERLKAAGVPEAHAKAEAEALAEALAHSDVATQGDLRELELRLIKWMVGLAFAQIALLLGILIKITV